MRSSITLYEDQYKLYKTGTKKLLIAFVEYMFEWIEPKLKPSEMAIFDMMRKSMDSSIKSHDGRSKWWQNSHWWPKWKMNEKWTKNEWKMNENAIWNTNGELQTINSWTTTINNILSYDNIYTSYYWANKWIDEKKCNKLLNEKIWQWITLDQINKSMVLYNCDCRIKQDFMYVKKFETWIKEFQPPNDEQLEEQLYAIVKSYVNKKKTDEKFWKSKPWLTIRNDLKATFWEEKVKWLLKQANSIQLNFT